MKKYKNLEAISEWGRNPENDDWYFVIYHTGKALAYYTKNNDRWDFIDGGSTDSSGILCWYDEVQ